MNKKSIKTPHPRKSGHSVKIMLDSTPNLIKRKEAARILGVHPETVRRWQCKNLLPAVIFNSRTTRYRREDILRLISDAVVGNLEISNPSQVVVAGPEDNQQ